MVSAAATPAAIHSGSDVNKHLRRFSKLVCFSTLFLIFMGGLVKSTESGLAVPDWPLSYGSLFPPMVGGVFYEHSHRMVASVVGLLMLILSVWLALKDQRKWVKTWGFLALGAVILQGVLGGLTVLFFLPDPISISHGVLAQLFFVMTIVLAYSQSRERSARAEGKEQYNPFFMQMTFIFIFMIFTQLFLGALMRHTESGLAIPDFPTMGGKIIPQFDQSMLANINLWRFENNYDFVTLRQVYIHFMHRFWAGAIILVLAILNYVFFTSDSKDASSQKTLMYLNVLIAVQVILGIATVLSKKEVYATTFHVAVGAAALGVSVLLMLRASPLQWNQFKKMILQKI